MKYKYPSWYHPVGRNHYYIDHTRRYISPNVREVALSVAAESESLEPVPVESVDDKKPSDMKRTAAEISGEGRTCFPKKLKSGSRENNQSNKTSKAPKKAVFRPKSKDKPVKPRRVFKKQIGSGKPWLISPLQQAVLQAKKMVEMKRKCKKGACTQSGNSISVAKTGKKRKITGKKKSVFKSRSASQKNNGRRKKASSRQ